jgi:hypothetical protein
VPDWTAESARSHLERLMPKLHPRERELLVWLLEQARLREVEGMAVADLRNRVTELESAQRAALNALAAVTAAPRPSVGTPRSQGTASSRPAR